MSDLPKGWIRARIGELCLPITKIDPRLQPDQSFTYIDIGAIEAETSQVGSPKVLLGVDAPSRARQVVAEGDTLISTVRVHLRNTAFVPSSLHGAVASTGFCILRPAPGTEPKFLFYRTLESGFVNELASRQTGSSYPAVRDADVRSMSVAVPPLAEQRRIVDAVEGCFSRIDAAEEVLNSTTKMAAIALRQIRVALLQGWPTAALAEVAEVVSGNTPKGLTNVPGGTIPFYKVGDMNSSDGSTMATARTWLDESSLKSLGIRVRPAGTVIFPKRGGAIATNKKRQLATPAAFDLNTMGVIAGERILQSYLLEWFQTIDLGALSDGSNIPQINNGDIGPLRIAVPPLDEQARLVAEIRHYSEAVLQGSAMVVSGLKRAATLRRSVLARAFSGLLLPQDPNEESADQLLQRVRAETPRRPDTNLARGRRRRE